MTKIITKKKTIVKRQATIAEPEGQKIVVKNQEGLEKANELGSKIQKAIKFVEQKKETYTRPAYDAWKKIMEQAKMDFDPVISRLKELRKEVDGKVIFYTRELEEKRREEEARLAAKVEEGKISIEKAAEKLEKLPEAPTMVEGKNGKSVIKKIKKFEVVDISKLPTS